MNIINPSVKLEHAMSEVDVFSLIEIAGRTCYKSEDKITSDSRFKFVKMIIDKEHHSVLEHVSLTTRFICDRGVSHELVRHRLASFSQESQRYCNYGGEDISFIKPHWFDQLDTTTQQKDIWMESMEFAERQYDSMLANGFSPQDARTVLPNSTKTEIVMTVNLRELMHILKLRRSIAAHPDMRLMMGLFINQLNQAYPNLMPLIYKHIYKD